MTTSLTLTKVLDTADKRDAYFHALDIARHWGKFISGDGYDAVYFDNDYRRKLFGSLVCQAAGSDDFYSHRGSFLVTSINTTLTAERAAS